MKKLLVLAAMAAVVLSANAKNLWTGNCSFANYQVESGDRPVFNPTDFSDAVIGDKIIFSITNNENDPESWHQVEIWQYDGEKPGPAAITNPGVHVLPGMTSVEFTLDETILQKLQAGPTCAAGTGYTVRSIELTEYTGVIWEGSSSCPDWTPIPPVNLPGSNFAMAQEGDILVFYVEEIIPGQYAALQIDTSTYEKSPFGETVLSQGQTEVRFILNATLLASLVTDGINFTGMNIKLTKIELVKGNGEVPPVEEGVVWTGSMTTADWTNSLTIPADKFGTLKAGNQLAFTYTDATDEAQIALKQNVDGWAEMPSDEGEYGNYLHLTAGSGVAYFTLNAEAAASINENGLVVAGVYYTVTKVQIVQAPVVENAIWTGSMTAGDWSNQLVLEPSKLAGVEEGTVLAFTVSNTEAGGAISLKQNLPEGWGEMPSDEGEYGNYLYFPEGDGVYYFTVNAAAAASMKQYGMVVAGLGYTLTQVAIAQGGGVASALLDAVSAPVYNLQGIRVADSLENINTPGIYISGGKKIFRK